MAAKTAPRKRRVPEIDKHGRTRAQRARDIMAEMRSRPAPHRWSKKAIAWALDVTGTSTLWRWVTQAKRDDDPHFDEACRRAGTRTDQPIGAYILLLEYLAEKVPPDVARQKTVMRRAKEREESRESYLRYYWGDKYIPKEERGGPRRTSQGD